MKQADRFGGKEVPIHRASAHLLQPCPLLRAAANGRNPVSCTDQNRHDSSAHDSGGTGHEDAHGSAHSYAVLNYCVHPPQRGDIAGRIALYRDQVGK